MAEFYIEKTQQSNGDFLVHKSTCASLPADKGAIRYLGAISNCGSAIKKASEFFKTANGCPQCNPDYHSA